MERKKLKLDELNRVDVETYKAQEKMPVALVLDNIRSGANVGSLFRTADAFAVEEIILLGICPKPPHREVLKTAIGATESVVWKHFEHQDEMLEYLSESGYVLMGLEQTTDSIPLENAPWHSKNAIVLGNEVEGVNSKLLDSCKSCIEIPQYGTKHSLNVSVSAGIALWQYNLLWRQILSADR